MNPQPKPLPDESEDDLETLEQEPEEAAEGLEQQPPAPAALQQPALPTSWPRSEPDARLSLQPASPAALNRQLLDLVTKRLEMQSDLIESLISRQEQLFSQVQQDRQGFLSLNRDLSLLSEMWQESLAGMRQHEESLTDAVAALIRLRLVQHPPDGPAG